jgi:hypothetical protein
MKNFQKFLEEITVKGNPGIPGEGGKKQGESDYLKDVEARAKRRLELGPGDMSRRGPMGPMPSPTEMRLGRELMGLLGQSMQFTTGHEEELSELATRVFTNLYNDLIERYEIEVDIKIVKPGKVKQFMDEEESEQENPVMPEFQEVVEEDIKNEVFKRKIANLIIQGEAKNTKHVLHSEEIKEGLVEIYGERDAQRIFDLWDKMTKIADKLDWIIPPDVRAEMMEQMPEGMAGASSVGWKPKEQKEEEEGEEGEETGEFFGQEEGEETGEFFGQEEGEEEYSEEEQEPMERFDKTPIIKARGVDFPMLLHEAVKALFELLSIPGIPEDERTANIALSNTGMSDEPEDWQYGPEIASDLRDFINLNKDIDKYPNIREEVYRMMIDKETMPTKKFLELMRGILSKTTEARREIDRMVAKVIKDKDEMEQYRKDMGEYEQQMKEWEEQQKRAPQQQSTSKPQPKVEEPEEEKPRDPKTMSQKEIQELVDKGLEDGDYDLVKYWSQFLKESSETFKIYQNEIKMILEGKNPHML